MTARAAQPMIDAIERVAERNRGVNRQGMGFSARRTSETHIADVSKLPVLAGEVSVTNDTGQNLFLLGYSQLGGPDLIG